jgi:hypothetical protein
VIAMAKRSVRNDDFGALPTSSKIPRKQRALHDAEL